MKKGIIFLCAIFFLLQANAQFLKFGLKGGANMVKIDGQSFKEGYQLGYFGGAFLELKLGENWYLQPEVLFSETNLTTSNDFRDLYGNLVDFNNISDMKLQALNIPVSINYKVSNLLSLSAGPQFSILLDRGESFMNNAQNAFAEGDLSLMTGANITIKKFRIFGRYLWGVKDLNGIDAQDKWRSQTARIGVGFVL